MHLNEVIKRLRHERGVGVPTVLAGLAGHGFHMATNTYYNWERKASYETMEFSVELVAALAEILGTTERKILEEMGFILSPPPEGGDQDDELLELQNVVRRVRNPFRRRRLINLLSLLVDLVER